MAATSVVNTGRSNHRKVWTGRFPLSSLHTNDVEDLPAYRARGYSDPRANQPSFWQTQPDDIAERTLHLKRGAEVHRH